MSALEQVILGGTYVEQDPAPSSEQIVEGVIHHTDATGVYFTVPDFDGGKYTFGPARGAGGVEGRRCLVVFAGAGIDRPWVVAVDD